MYTGMFKQQSMVRICCYLTPSWKHLEINLNQFQRIFDRLSISFRCFLTTIWNPNGNIKCRLMSPINKWVSSHSCFNLGYLWFRLQLQLLDFHQVQGTNSSDHHFALSETDLPHIITSIEGKLGNSISDNPTIHLVVYVPPCSTSPLHIYNAKGQRISQNGTDSFISPKWGGIVIANPTKDECAKYMETQSRADINVNSKHVMHTILYLLRKIIDIDVTNVSQL